MKIAEETFTLSEEDRKGLLEKRLTYGDLPPKKVKEIVALSQRYVLESLGHKGTPPQGVILSSGDFKTPGYLPTIQGIIERIVRSPMAYFDGLKALDLMLFDYIVPRIPYEPKTVPNFTEYISIDEAVKIGKNFIAAACDSAKVSRESFWVSIPGNEGKNEAQKPVQFKMEM